MVFEATDEVLQVLNSSLSQLKWRLKPPAKRRLEIDVLALLTGMRPVIMVDYGGKMPELQQHLCALIKQCHQESAVFECLRVMVVDDMIYLIHTKGLAEYARTSLNSEAELIFVNLEQDPLEMVSQKHDCPLGSEFLRLQRMFSRFFPLDEAKDAALLPAARDTVANVEPSTSLSDGHIDLSSCMKDTQITVPTLNGWLLGYPVVYLFGKEFISEAICNLSTKNLHLFRILVRRCQFLCVLSINCCNSFSVPYELSMRGRKEPWAEAFLERLQCKWQSCKQTWVSLEMEVDECYPQAIVL
ncbi:unnamed protein product [Linum tenue]|uniref:Uncharacterized protein n=1 Tax=Linum tenue TaxID=586396 RepID=A0AAV0M404_9ROSI|nr:unnamed protein product [Linum tenue]